MNQEPTNQPTTVDQAYPEKWLKARHLKGRAVVLTVSRAYAAQIWNSQRKGKEWKIVLDFGRKLDLILSPTQARQMEKAAGTGCFAHWGGVRVMIAPTSVSPGRETITISRPPEKGEQ